MFRRRSHRAPDPGGEAKAEAGSLGKRLLPHAAMFALTLIGLEVGARWLCYEDVAVLFPRRETTQTLTRGALTAHPTRGYALRPGYRDERYRINGAGFRGAEITDEAPELLVAALGDSTTFGWGVDEEETYPHQLAQVLRERGAGGVAVVNGGVPGYTSRQVAIRLRELLAGEPRPDLLLVSVLYNDIWMSTVANWHPGLLVQKPPPAIERWLREYSGVYRCFLVSRAAGSDLVDVFNAEAFAHYRSNLEEIMRLAREHDVPLLLLEPPFSFESMPPQGLNRFHIRYTRDFFRELARRHLAALAEPAGRYGAVLVDHRLSMASAPRRELFVDPIHPNSRGYGLMARDVASFLIEGGYARIRETDPG